MTFGYAGIESVKAHQFELQREVEHDRLTHRFLMNSKKSRLNLFSWIKPRQSRK